MQWLPAALTAIAAFIPVVFGIRFTRASRLRRRLEQDLALASAAKDEKTLKELNALTSFEASELHRLERENLGVHPGLVAAVVYLVFTVFAFSAEGDRLDVDVSRSVLPQPDWSPVMWLMAAVIWILLIVIVVMVGNWTVRRIETWHSRRAAITRPETAPTSDAARSSAPSEPS